MPHPIYDHEHPDHIRPSLNNFGEETRIRQRQYSTLTKHE